MVRLRQKNIIDLRLTLTLGVALYFLSLQVLLGQDNWIQVSSPNNSFNSLDVFGETYYKMPPQFLSPNSNFGKSSQKEISLPNEKGEEEIFILTSAPLLSKALSIKYPEINKAITDKAEYTINDCAIIKDPQSLDSVINDW